VLFVKLCLNTILEFRGNSEAKCLSTGLVSLISLNTIFSCFHFLKKYFLKHRLYIYNLKFVKIKSRFYVVIVWIIDSQSVCCIC
jgi:hypothetical protein